MKNFYRFGDIGAKQQTADPKYQRLTTKPLTAAGPAAMDCPIIERR
jgi:hypothetical protein